MRFSEFRENLARYKLHLKLAVTALTIGLFFINCIPIYADTGDSSDNATVFNLADSTGSTDYHTLAFQSPGVNLNSWFHTTVYHMYINIDGTPLPSSAFYYEGDLLGSVVTVNIKGKYLYDNGYNNGTYAIVVGACGLFGGDAVTLKTVYVSFKIPDGSDTQDPTGSSDDGNSTVDNPTQGATGTQQGGGSTNSQQNTGNGNTSTQNSQEQLMIDPSLIIFIKGLSVINWMAMVYFVYWLILLMAAMTYEVFELDFFIQKVTFNKRTIETDSDYKELKSNLIFGFFVIAAYFSGAYLYITYEFLNVVYMIFDMFIQYINSL